VTQMASREQCNKFHVSSALMLLHCEGEGGMIVTFVAAQFVTEDRSGFVSAHTTPKGYLGVKATPYIILLVHIKQVAQNS